MSIEPRILVRLIYICVIIVGCFLFHTSIFLNKIKGKQHRSFVDLAIAMAHMAGYEVNCRRNEFGQGWCTLKVNGENVLITTDDKGVNAIKILEVIHTPLLVEVASVEAFLQSLNARNDGYVYSARDSENGIDFDIATEMDVDPTEKDAELYIGGYVEEITKERMELRKAFDNWVETHPDDVVSHIPSDYYNPEC